MLRDLPSGTEVTGALERVLASQTFARSERARKLLRHLVEAEQAGRGGDLKGFSIAVDVFGRDGAFDPSTDSVVRVQAGRLRDLLAIYYAGEGKTDSVVIAVPRGSYAPNYVRSVAAAVPPPVEIEAGPRDRSPGIGGRARAWTLAAAAACLGVVIVAAAWPARIEELPVAVATPRSAPAERSVELRPTVAMRTLDANEEVVAFASTMRIGLAGFDTIDFIRGAAGPDDDWGASYVFDVTPGLSEGDIHVELTSAGPGKVLLSRVVRADSVEGVADAVTEILTMTLPTSGLIYNNIRQSGLESPLTRCLLLANAYYSNQTAARHETAYRCLEDLRTAGVVSPLIHAELAGLHLEAVTDGHPFPPDATAETAFRHARRAIEIGPTSPLAHRALGFVLSRTGGKDEAVQWMREASELNPYDLTMAAAHGYGLVQAGRYAESLSIMRRAVRVSSARPVWWDYTLFLGAFMTGEMDSATRASGALAARNTSNYLAARLIAAVHGGKSIEVADLLNEINREFPQFAIDPRAHFEDARYPDDMTDRLVEALSAAGLGKG